SIRESLESQPLSGLVLVAWPRPKTYPSAPSSKPLPHTTQSQQTFILTGQGPHGSEQSVIASRPSFLIGELLLGKVSETIVVVGNAPHDRPGFLVGHLIGNRASFLCTKAPMLRIPETNFLHGIRSYWARCSGDLPPSPPHRLRHNSVNG